MNKILDRQRIGVNQYLTSHVHPQMGLAYRYLSEAVSYTGIEAFENFLGKESNTTGHELDSYAFPGRYLPEAACKGTGHHPILFIPFFLFLI